MSAATGNKYYLLEEVRPVPCDWYDGHKQGVVTYTLPNFNMFEDNGQETVDISTDEQLRAQRFLDQKKAAGKYGHNYSSFRCIWVELSPNSIGAGESQISTGILGYGKSTLDASGGTNCDPKFKPCAQYNFTGIEFPDTKPTGDEPWEVITRNAWDSLTTNIRRPLMLKRPVGTTDKSDIPVPAGPGYPSTSEELGIGTGELEGNQINAPFGVDCTVPSFVAGLLTYELHDSGCETDGSSCDVSGLGNWPIGCHPKGNAMKYAMVVPFTAEMAETSFLNGPGLNWHTKRYLLSRPTFYGQYNNSYLQNPGDDDFVSYDGNLTEYTTFWNWENGLADDNYFCHSTNSGYYFEDASMPTDNATKFVVMGKDEFWSAKGSDLDAEWIPADCPDCSSYNACGGMLLPDGSFHDNTAGTGVDCPTCGNSEQPCYAIWHSTKTDECDVTLLGGKCRRDFQCVTSGNSPVCSHDNTHHQDPLHLPKSLCLNGGPNPENLSGPPIEPCCECEEAQSFSADSDLNDGSYIMDDENCCEEQPTPTPPTPSPWRVADYYVYKRCDGDGPERIILYADVDQNHDPLNTDFHSKTYMNIKEEHSIIIPHPFVDDPDPVVGCYEFEETIEGGRDPVELPSTSLVDSEDIMQTDALDSESCCPPPPTGEPPSTTNDPHVKTFFGETYDM